jgi:hypothetical protein
VLGAIPGLDALVEGHLRGAAGTAVVASIKDANQQDALLARWQGSSVFRAFFGHNGPPPGLQPAAGGAAAAAATATSTAAAAAAVRSREVEMEEEEDDVRDETPPLRLPPARRVSQQPPASQRSRRSVSSFVAAAAAAAVPEQPRLPAGAATLGSPFQPRDSLSDIVATDAAQSYAHLSLLVCMCCETRTD